MGYTKLFNKVKLGSYEGRMKLFLPLIKFLAKLKITPNDITVFRLIFVVPLAYSFYLGNLWAALILGLVFTLVDFLDGDLARYLKVSNDKGRFLDTVVDNFFYSAIIIGFIYICVGNKTVLAYHLLIQLTVQVLAVVKKQKGQPSNWLIKTEANEPIFKSISHTALCLYIVFNFNIINIVFVVLNAWMSIAALYYLLAIKNSK